jgi:hypothetical protein
MYVFKLSNNIEDDFFFRYLTDQLQKVQVVTEANKVSTESNELLQSSICDKPAISQISTYQAQCMPILIFVHILEVINHDVLI